MDSLKILPLGACLLHGPLGYAIRENRNISCTTSTMGTGTPALYSVGEALQAFKFFRGEIDIPQPYLPLVDIDAGFDPRSQEGHRFFDGDVAMFEPNMPVDIHADGVYFNRACIISRVLNPIKAVSEDAARTAYAWWTQGITVGNDAVTVELANKIIGFIPQEMPDKELAIDLLRKLRGIRHSRETLTQGIRQVRDEAGLPMVIVTYTHNYMPDGRAMPWPPDFVEDTIAAAKTLDLPIFHPADFVVREGVANALMKDRTHYQDHFSAMIGREMVKFGSAVLQRRAA